PDIDEPRRGRADKQRLEQSRQQEGREIVDGEAKLEAVLADLPLGRVTPPETDSGVVDQDVEAVMIGEDLVGETAYLRQRGEVSQVEGQAIVAGGRADLAHDRLSPHEVAAVQQDGGAGRGQLVR